MQGYDVALLTGTDEHGDNIPRAAAKLDAANPMTWLTAAGFGGALVATCVLYLRMNARQA